MSKTAHPYSKQPDQAFWRRAVGGIAPSGIEPIADLPLKITHRTKVATAGSCFAQNIARNLSSRGFNYYIAEHAHPLINTVDDTDKDFGYTTFSARYGNIYTARQLRQLIERAYGSFFSEEDAWPTQDGRFCDPFRPTVEPDGFASLAELSNDRVQHLAAVRKMFETLDVFVFTLGLTEGWESKTDGAAFPICPGVQAGQFNPSRYRFFNQTVAEVVTDMTTFLARLRTVNPKANVILTVSPVPLVATAEDRHVLVSTVASKAILRAAADELERAEDNVHYFPSFEIITSTPNAARYFGPDLRSVTEDGVDHVMRVFFNSVTDGGEQEDGSTVSREPRASEDHAETIFQAVCDEEALDSVP